MCVICWTLPWSWLQDCYGQGTENGSARESAVSRIFRAFRATEAMAVIHRKVESLQLHRFLICGFGVI
jgi:hypothetical protein